MNVNFDSQTEEVRIEIVPLIDVIFCILTFFILAAVSLTRQQAINVDLPQASTGAPQMQDMLLVSIDSIGQVYVEQQPVTIQQLTDVLGQYEQAVPEGLLVLYASRNARYAEVVQVLDLLREVGGDRVALATLPEASIPMDPNDPGLSNPSQDDLLLPSDPFGAPGSNGTSPGLGAPGSRGTSPGLSDPLGGDPLNPLDPGSSDSLDNGDSGLLSPADPGSLPSDNADN